ncbi:hypothetical protein VY88_27110 [Azospirillum thiophilum]|uniref:Uncharacterized protein n=1 Tax=Azospirillum thiophilum TaxID=528244 RepID=A0AAC8ZW73_9PROT|nr:hypothetical protein [Azospirillum thiophilum]ALG75174.1 hypothetical protein AL072_30010 [Azospirillum thiophilum]KJR62568.1 hypothetical protein VY88_27110 [Azospirillum thiophilum]
MTVIGHCTACGERTRIDRTTRLCDGCTEEGELFAALPSREDTIALIGRHLFPKEGDHHAP